MNRDQNEAERLRSLHSYGVLDTQPESRYDDLTQIAASICDTPIALVSLVDGYRQWFKSRVGLDAQETPRDQAFCAHAIETPQQLFVVDDAMQDPRFADNPLVTGDPNIRFYAGAPIVNADQQAMGTLCVIDTKPRQLNEKQKAALQALARQARDQLELGRANDQLRKSLAELDEYTNIVAHDLKSPLLNIRGFSEILSREYGDLLDVKATEYLRYISDGARHMDEMVKDMLAYARVDQQDIELAPVDMQALCSEVLVLLAPGIQDLNGDVRIAGRLPEVYGHKTLLQELLQNLIENALKYHRPEVPPEVVIGAEIANAMHLFSVQDNGMGIEAKFHDEAFKAFSRLNPSKNSRGSGLGLAFCRKSVELHGGKIWIESTPGQGSTIKFTLPA